jgi:hypothetical protein
MIVAGLYSLPELWARKVCWVPEKLSAISLLYGMFFVYAHLAAEGRQSSCQFEGRVYRGLAVSAMRCLTTERHTQDQLELNRSTLTRRTCAIGSYVHVALEQT